VPVSVSPHISFPKLLFSFHKNRC